MSRGAAIVVGSDGTRKVQNLQTPNPSPQLEFPVEPVVTAQEAHQQPTVVEGGDLLDTACQDLEQLFESKQPESKMMNIDIGMSNSGEETTDALLDKLLVTAGVVVGSDSAESDGGSSVGGTNELGEAQAWEESFNELFPDLI